MIRRPAPPFLLVAGRDVRQIHGWSTVSDIARGMILRQPLLQRRRRSNCWFEIGREDRSCSSGLNCDHHDIQPEAREFSDPAGSLSAARQGVWGRSPQFPKGGRAGTKDICLIGLCGWRRTSPSLNTYRRKPVRDRSRRFCYTGPTHVTGASRLIQQRPSSVVPLSRLLHPALAHCCTSLDRGTLFPHAIHTYDYPHPTTRAAPGGMYRL